MSEKIVVTHWSGKSWEMTSEQILAAYRYQENQFRIADAKNQLELNADWIEEQYGYTYGEILEFAEELAERYHDNEDCNVSENDMWVSQIERMFEAAGTKE